MSNVNWPLIYKQEGGLLLKGYVPNRHGVAIGNSGVTIAAGFDLGQRTVEEIKSIPGITALEFKLLSPYCGLRKDKAIAYLDAHPLSITECLANKLESYICNQFEASLSRRWKKDKKAGFKYVSEGLATALASFAFQYGNVYRAAPKYWSLALAGDLNGCVDWLCSRKSYASRRKAEAEWIKKDISSVE